MVTPKFVKHPSTASTHHYPAFKKKRQSQPQILDTLLVFGQGPVRQVKLSSELTTTEKKEWAKFKKDPLASIDPDFFVVESSFYLAELLKIDNVKDNNPTQKKLLKAALRTRWQRSGQFALKRLGRLNALAAGLLLLSGVTKEIIITGGHTISERTKKELKEKYKREEKGASSLSQEQFEKKFALYLKYFMKWPSEAELMADLIKAHFAFSYKEKYGHDIEDVIKLDTHAANTIENIIFSINNNPRLLDRDAKVGILSVTHHLKRIEALTKKFGIKLAKYGVFSSQQVLMQRYLLSHMKLAAREANYLQDIGHSVWLKGLLRGEKQFLKGLTEMEYLTYWIGYAFEFEDPKLIEEVLKPLLSDSLGKKAVDRAFSQVGIDYRKIEKNYLEHLATEDPEVYDTVRNRLIALTKPPYRGRLPLD